jgi:teichuronic acid biosynthesis glycosyltransferase TuaC
LKIKILTYTTLFPDSTRPTYGVFVENRLRHLVEQGAIESRVVSPVPWFFSKAAWFGQYSQYARVPHREIRHDIHVEHPRYPVLPKIGMIVAPFLLAAATQPAIHRITREGFNFDILDAHYFYPDGVAAAIISRSLNKPFVVTARGSDLNLIAGYRIPRRLIQWAAGRASGLVTVCQALKDRLMTLGVKSNQITVLRNGVDLCLFKPPDNRDFLRQSLGLTDVTFLSVGGLTPSKGHDLIIRAMASFPEASLLIVGTGPEGEKLRKLISALRLKERVQLLGLIEHERLAAYYGAADALILASDREGWANVLLESMACGTPVIATKIGGNPEVVADPAAGILIEQRTPEAISAAMHKLLAAKPYRHATRYYAEKFSWDDTSAGLTKLFHSLVGSLHEASDPAACSNAIV